MAGLADDLHRAADPVVDVEAVALGRQTRCGPTELDDETLTGLAQQPQAGGRVKVADDDFFLDHVRDGRVVPDALDRDLLTPHLHAGDGRYAAEGEHIVGHERAEVVVEAIEAIDPPGRPAHVWAGHIGERIRIDGDNRAYVRAEVVAHDDGLGASDEDRRGGVGAATAAVGGGCAGEDARQVLLYA